MKATLTTAKMTPVTLDAARFIAACTREKQYEVFERLLVAEARRLGRPAAFGRAKPRKEKTP